MAFPRAARRSAISLAALLAVSGCDILFFFPPVTAVEATGIFADITTTDDSSCSVFSNGGLVVVDFTNFDKEGVGASVSFVANPPPSPHVAVFEALGADVSRPDDICPFSIGGTVRFEHGEAAPGPAGTRRENEEFVPLIIHTALFEAQELCTGLCTRECEGEIPESRLVDVRMFCAVQ